VKRRFPHSKARGLSNEAHEYSARAETRDGTTSYSEATAEGVVADTAVPIADAVAASASTSLSQGVVVSVTRTTPQVSPARSS
jgi:hypothetical protein